MSFVYHRTYKGPVKLVIFDWAGTTLDYGCYAPAAYGAEKSGPHKGNFPAG